MKIERIGTLIIDEDTLSIQNFSFSGEGDLTAKAMLLSISDMLKERAEKEVEPDSFIIDLSGKCASIKL